MPSYIPEHVYHPYPWPRHQIQRGAAPKTNKPPKSRKKRASTEDASVMETGGVFFLTLSRHDRAGIAYAVELLINMLDAMEPDQDLEPSLGWFAHGNQTAISRMQTGPADADECEEGSEDEGADIIDKPHDAVDEGNDEPNLGWSEKRNQFADLVAMGIDPGSGEDVDNCEGMPGGLAFRGDGYGAAKQALRALAQRRPDVRQEYVHVTPGVIPDFKATDFDRLPWA